MPTPYQTDHLEELLGETLAQLRSRPKYAALLAGLADQIQELEDDLFDLRNDQLLANAAGEQLDRYGRLVGELRGGLSDADYRRFIGARILSNLCEGTVDELIEILRIISAPQVTGTVVEYQERYPAAFDLRFFRGTWLSTLMRARVSAHMGDLSPAGVGMRVVEGTDLAFRLDVGPGLDFGELSRIVL